MPQTQNSFKQLKTAASLLIVLTLLTGLIYPLMVTTVAQLFFPWRANGSLLRQNNVLIGSELIGQAFTQPHYFWGRPSATTPYPYNALASVGSNLGPSNPALFKVVQNRKLFLQTAHGSPSPADLLMASGSGLDPHISPAAAYYQIPRVAKARNISEEKLYSVVTKMTENPMVGILGQARVNVLLLNLKLDTIDLYRGQKSIKPPLQRGQPSVFYEAGDFTALQKSIKPPLQRGQPSVFYEAGDFPALKKSIKPPLQRRQLSVFYEAGDFTALKNPPDVQKTHVGLLCKGGLIRSGALA